MVDVEDVVRMKFESVAPHLDERGLRVWAGAEAEAIGWGGPSIVARATGLSRTTVRRGRDEARMGLSAEDLDRVRAPGAGRPRKEVEHPELLGALEALVEPVSRGDPESPLRWTSKSTYKLSDELKAQGFEVSPQKVGKLLRENGYSMQAMQKSIEGKQHVDRDEQFEHINALVDDFQEHGEPVVSVDTKKKELVGAFKKAGREWQPTEEPVPALVHDFPSDALGKAIPYGVYDVTENKAMVNVGVDHDTSAFAVASIERWWIHMGRQTYPDATELLIVADAGGSNSHRTRLWKAELQLFANHHDLIISVSHFPPGTSKWNKIEHRLFNHITENWRGRPLVDYETVVNLIGSVRTSTGLAVKAKLDRRKYPTGLVVDDEEMEGILIERDSFHGAWNYTIYPHDSSDD